MCWSWGWCILHGLACCGWNLGRHRYTPADTPAQAPPPSQTVSQGWAAGSQSAATVKEEKENLKTCWCIDFVRGKGTILYFLSAFDLSGMYLNKHELVHWLVPLQQHHAGLQTATQKHATSLQVFSCRGRDRIKEHADLVLWLWDIDSKTGRWRII